jgi:adenylate kinase
MTLELKDIVYLITYILSFMGLLITTTSRLKSLEKKFYHQGKVIYGDRGKLNVIDADTCKKHRDDIFVAIRRNERINEMMISKLDYLNENILIIKAHMGIHTPNGIRLDVKKDKDNL